MFHRIGAICFIVWGLLHINAAYMQYMFGSSLEPGLVQGRLLQNSWHLLAFGILAIVIGARYNWRNSRLGYWINVLALAVVDIGFIVFVLVPYLPILSAAVLGPVFWVLAVSFATLGYLREATMP